VFGQFTWEPIFPRGHGASLRVVPYEGISVRYEHGEIVSQYDDRILRAAAPVLDGKMGPWDLVVLHLFESDPLAHAVGTVSDHYRNHLRWVDRKIEELSRRISADGPTTFVMLADHGQADDGTHGGLSNVERQVLFLAWGAGVKPGNLGTFPLFDAAPTLSALLGVPPPASAEGWPLDVMQATPRQKADILMDLAQQRLRRWASERKTFPWVVGNPASNVSEFERLYRSGRFDAAAAASERCVHSLDKAMDDALPEKWLWRFIAALWAMVLAAGFGLTWNKLKIPMVRFITALSGVYVLLLILPLLGPGAWSLTSVMVLVASALIMLLALMTGLKNQSGFDGYGWFLWWLALLGIAFQGIFDVALWSWLMLAGLFVGRAMHLDKNNALTSVLSFSVVAACAVLSSGIPAPESSLVRFVLPRLHWAAMARLDWRDVAVVLCAAWVIAGYYPFVRRNEAPMPWTTFAFIMGPLALAAALMRLRPAAAAWSWPACAASFVAMLWLRPAPAIRGMWLSAITLAYYRTLADDRQWCLLAMAVAAGWLLAWKSRDAHPLWEGIGLLGIGLWSYQLSGAQLSFSHITVAEGQRMLGEGWHPYALLAVLALKPMTAIGAPILPRLANRPIHSILGILPLLGSMSAGNLTALWLKRFMVGDAQKLTDTDGFAQTEFILVLAWMLLGLWAAVRAGDWLSERLARLRGVT
jgi:hypothetical protein